jgi:hypothetical protein
MPSIFLEDIITDPFDNRLTLQSGLSLITSSAAEVPVLSPIKENNVNISIMTHIMPTL